MKRQNESNEVTLLKRDLIEKQGIIDDQRKIIDKLRHDKDFIESQLETYKTFYSDCIRQLYFMQLDSL